jgi:hypothetical protein
MGAAEKMPTVTGQEAVRKQLERRPLMRAGIAIAQQKIATAIDEEIEPCRTIADQESARGPLRNILDPAKADPAVLRR